jgi:hypothetical protein
MKQGNSSKKDEQRGVFNRAYHAVIGVRKMTRYYLLLKTL